MRLKEEVMKMAGSKPEFVGNVPVACWVNKVKDTGEEFLSIQFQFDKIRLFKNKPKEKEVNK